MLASLHLSDMYRKHLNRFQKLSKMDCFQNPTISLMQFAWKNKANYNLINETCQFTLVDLFIDQSMF